MQVDLFAKHMLLLSPAGAFSMTDVRARAAKPFGRPIDAGKVDTELCHRLVQTSVWLNFATILCASFPTRKTDCRSLRALLHCCNWCVPSLHCQHPACKHSGTNCSWQAGCATSATSHLLCYRQTG